MSGARKRGALAALLVLACAAWILSPPLAARQSAATGRVSIAALKEDVDGFFDREMVAHLRAIPAEGPLPDRVHGALTTGEFSWGTFVRALAAYADIRGSRTVDGRDVIPLIARVGVSESAKGSKAFAQLYAALALRHFGTDLARNPLWQSLSDTERTAWRALLDPTRFYDPKTRQVIDLPENYLGVASRIATLSFQMGVLTDRAFVDSLLDRAAEPFVKGALYADDAGTSGRYDRYSNEYARYVYESAATVGRRDLLDALRPSLTAQMALWWDLVSPGGYGYQWGRSLGVVSYLDTLEIVAFVAAQPEFRPAPLPDLVAAYSQAWRWLRANYDADRHMLQVFAPGRGNYAYISKDREWQQNVGFFGKALVAHDMLVRVLGREGLTSVPERPRLADVARFVSFRGGERPAGVWVVRQGPLRFALPVTSGTRPGVADYLPAPHGLPGFVAPVEQVAPAGASFYELADGRVVTTSDGADTIEPSIDGRSLRATWRRLALIGAKTGTLVEPGFTVSVTWRIDGRSLMRTETVTAARDVSIRRRWLLVSSTATRHERVGPVVRLAGPEGTLDVRADADPPVTVSERVFGDEPLGRGPRLPAATHVTFEVAPLEVRADTPLRWTLTWVVSEPAPSLRD